MGSAMRWSWEALRFVPIGLLAGLIAGFISMGVGFSKESSVIFSFIAMIWAFLVEEAIRSRISVKPILEILSDETEVLDKAAQMQKQAERLIQAMWTTMVYTDVLRDYFTSTMRNAFTHPARSVERVIDLDISLPAILDHLRSCWEYLKEGRYKVFFIRRLDFEALIIDHKVAALFIGPGPGYEFLYLKSAGPDFVTVISGEFERIKTQATLFPIQQFSLIFEEAEVKSWLEQIKEGG